MSTETIVQTLERAPDLVIPLVHQANSSIVKRRPANARWSIHEHACHLAEVHPLMTRRLDLMLAEEHPRIQRLRHLQPVDWQRTAIHDEYNSYSVFTMFRHLAMHDYFHAYRIEELVLRKDWPPPRV